MSRSIPVMAKAVAAAVVCAAAGPAAASTFGIAAHIPSEPVQEEIVATGIGWVRIDVVWSLIEVEPDTFWWDGYDALIATLESRGLRIYATIQGTPQWATSGSEFNGVPDEPGDWQAFCYSIASRYRGRIDAWGFWNEPNLEHFWEGSRTEYVEEILLPGIAAVAAADPDALLVAPDLAHLTSGHWDDWLGRVISDAGHLLDVVAHHVYPSNGTSGDVTNKLNDDPTYPWEPPSVRQVLDDSGWGPRPFWLTETGVESDRYTQVGQATFYRGMLERWFGTNPDDDWIDRIFFYEMADPRGVPTLSWGILEEPPGLERKLAFYEYQAFIGEALVDDAEVTGSPLPSFVGSFEELEASFTVRNTGTTPWSTSEGYALELRIDQLGWAVSVDGLPPDTTVSPGDAITVRALLRSPGTTPAAPVRTALLTGRMVRDGVDPFGTGVRHLFAHTGREAPVVSSHPAPVSVPYNGTAAFDVEVASPPDVNREFVISPRQ